MWELRKYQTEKIQSLNISILGVCETMRSSNGYFVSDRHIIIYVGGEKIKGE